MNLGDKTRTLSVRLNDELADFVFAQAKEMGVKPSDYVRILLRVGLAMERNKAKMMADGIQEATKIIEEMK